MTLAFVLLKVELGKEPEVIQELHDINESPPSGVLWTHIVVYLLV